MAVTVGKVDQLLKTKPIVPVAQSGVITDWYERRVPPSHMFLKGKHLADSAFERIRARSVAEGKTFLSAAEPGETTSSKILKDHVMISKAHISSQMKTRSQPSPESKPWWPRYFATEPQEASRRQDSSDRQVAFQAAWSIAVWPKVQ